MVARVPWLGRDDLLASGFFAGACALIAGCAWAWTIGLLSTPWTILGIMVGQSILHEMEHDLIHDLYLPHAFVRNSILATIWLVKASVDPWKRGRWHRWHHAVSGQAEDIEERLIGMGLPWGPLRILITVFPPVALVIKPALHRAMDRRVAAGIRRPTFAHAHATWAFEAVTAVLVSLPLVAIGGWFAGAAWTWPLLVLWVLPNTIRHAAIAFMSSNSHYTHISRNDILEQNQILDHPVFWPLQALCWNFGATHVVHHFLVRQPFWRRTLLFPRVRSMLVEHGVRANDFQSLRRANRRTA